VRDFCGALLANALIFFVYFGGVKHSILLKFYLLTPALLGVFINGYRALIGRVTQWALRAVGSHQGYSPVVG